ncbi:MAG: hypothetical protein WCD70_07180 [Alphaproteobacteria bacterium]
MSSVLTPNTESIRDGLLRELSVASGGADILVAHNNGQNVVYKTIDKENCAKPEGVSEVIEKYQAPSGEEKRRTNLDEETRHVVEIAKQLADIDGVKSVSLRFKDCAIECYGLLPEAPKRSFLPQSIRNLLNIR